MSDAEAIAVLNEEVQRAHLARRPDRFKRPNREQLIVELVTLLGRPENFAFVAENDAGVLEGYALSTIRTRPETAITFSATYVELDQVAVRTQSRHTGIGRSLISEVVRHAKSLAVERVELSTWDFNVDAHLFFESLGFSPDFRRFSLTLEGLPGHHDS